MAECLVTTLKENVNDTSLLKLGEMTFRLGTNNDTRCSFLVRSGGDNTNCTIVEGEGYFTDKTGTQNYGKVKSFPRTETAYVSSPNCKIKIENKYVLTTFAPNNFVELDLGDFIASTELVNFNIISFSPNKIIGGFKSLANCHNLRGFTIYWTDLAGDNISNLPNIDGLEALNLGGSNVTGDLAVFNNNNSLKELRINATKIGGNISSLPSAAMNFVAIGDTSISGNLNVFAGNTTMTTLSVYKTNVTGNISSLSQCTNLIDLDVHDTSISGDTSSLAGLTNLTTFNYTNSNVTGTWPLV